MKNTAIKKQLHAIGFKDDFFSNELIAGNLRVKVIGNDVEVQESGQRLNFANHLTIADKISRIKKSTVTGIPIVEFDRVKTATVTVPTKPPIPPMPKDYGGGVDIGSDIGAGKTGGSGTTTSKYNVPQVTIDPGPQPGGNGTGTSTTKDPNAGYNPNTTVEDPNKEEPKPEVAQTQSFFAKNKKILMIVAGVLVVFLVLNKKGK